MTKPLRTFIIYAREDRDAVDEVRRHLKQAEKKNLLTIWDDGEILPGEDWNVAIKNNLKEAQLILLFVSVDFINSDYIETTELQAALTRHSKQEVVLIPIIVRRCDWMEHFGMGQFQALPKEARPIKSVDLSVREEVYYEVAKSIKDVAAGLQEKALKAEAEREKAAEAERAERMEADKKARQAALRQQKDEAAWEAAREENTKHAYEAYLEEGFVLHETEAKKRITALQTAEIKQKAADRAAQEARVEAERKTREDAAAHAKAAAEKKAREEAEAKAEAERKNREADPFEDLMIHIKGGTFEMGDVFKEGFDWEQPVHKVTVKDFYLCKYPVTQGQWKKIMGNNPSHFKGDDMLPVEGVSWKDAQVFIKTLNKKIAGGRQYRLPTEAEWEYAAREGGKRVRFGNGKDVADANEMNFDASEKYKQPYSLSGEYRGETTPVHQFKPNALGLYDMSGNVWEWCEDDWHSDYKGAPDNGAAWIDSPRGSDRVFRGGGWYRGARYCRVSGRNNSAPANRGNDLGFRLASSPQ